MTANTREFLSIEELKRQSAQDLQTILKQDVYYKYASFHTTSNFIIPNQTLRFSPPAIFNDPFDCNEDLLDIHIDPASVRNFAKDSLSKFPPEIQDQLIQLAVHPGSYRAALQQEKVNFKICCFSTKPDNILMWSHYADKHNGICLGFKFPVRGEEFSMYPVRYIDQIKKLHGMADTASIFHYWLTRKPMCWAYESEIRAISRSGAGDIAFSKDQLKEVIFGCKVSQQMIDSFISQMIHFQFKDVQFKKMEIDPESFLLRLHDLS
ncbi:MAG: DUF2971 domain-containing protein [Mucilaginibacter sp.]